MDENELFKAWEESSSDEQEKFQETQVQLKNIAKLKTTDVFKKIKTNIFWEMVVTIPVAIVFPFLFWNEKIFFWLVLTLTTVSGWVSFRIYQRYLQDLKKINEHNLIVSLEKKIKILRRYVKQLNFYVILLGPIGFGIGFGFALKQQEVTFIRLIILACVVLPFAYFMVWLFKKYIYQLYGRYLKSLEEIYASLTE